MNKEIEFQSHEVVKVPMTSKKDNVSWHTAVIKVLWPPYAKVIILDLKSKPELELKLSDVQKFNGEIR